MTFNEYAEELGIELPKFDFSMGGDGTYMDSDAGDLLGYKLLMQIPFVVGVYSIDLRLNASPYISASILISNGDRLNVSAYESNMGTTKRNLEKVFTNMLERHVNIKRTLEIYEHTKLRPKY